MFVDSNSSFQGAEYSYYLSYLYDLSEQESSLYALRLYGTASTSDKYIQKLVDGSGDPLTDPTALYISVTVDYNNTNGYAFNKRIVGARLYYTSTTDIEDLFFHLLDIDFEKGVRKTGDEVFTSWGTNIGQNFNDGSVHVPIEHNGIVECPYGSNHDIESGTTGDAINSEYPEKDGAYHFQFNDPPTSEWYYTINGFEPTDKTYFRFKTAVISDLQLWVGNIGEVDSSGKVIRRFGDQVIRCPQGKFDTLSMDAIDAGRDIGINDGDNVVKLEYLKDRLLVFKRYSLYVLNIRERAYIEEERRFLGISHPASSIKTEFGISWVNKRGCYLYTGEELVNLTENKIDPEEWKNYISNNPLVGYINHKRQLFVVRDSSATNDDTFYIYDYSTQSWSKNVGGIGMNPKSNIINAHDVNGVYNGNALYSTLDEENSTQEVIVNQASASTETVSAQYTASGGGSLDSRAVVKGVIGEYSSGTITVGWNGEELTATVALDKYFFLCYGLQGTMTIDDSTEGTLTNGTHLTPKIPSRNVANMSTNSELADYINKQINNYTGTSGYTSEVSGNIITITKNAVGTTDNRKTVLFAHNGDDHAGTWTLKAKDIDTFTSSTILGGVTAVDHVVQIGIAGVTAGGATLNRFGFTITELDENSWKNKITKYKEGGKTVLIEHKGGSDTSLYLGGASGSDINNELVAENLQARTNGNTMVTDSTVGFGITVSDVKDAGSVSGADDISGDDIFYFSLSRSTPFEVRSQETYVEKSIREFTNENKSNVGGYKLITKEFDFGEPSVRKKIYKVYITFRSVDENNNYSDSGVKVYYGTDGKDLTPLAAGTEFSAASSKYYSTIGGLAALDSSSNLNTTLTEAISSTTQGASISSDIHFADGSNIMKNGVIQIGSEQMLIEADMNGDNTTNDTVTRGYNDTTAVTHLINAEVLVARTDQYVTAELNPSSGINNVRSFQL